ncbi:MAG: UvrD-helicase domain-containing protein [Candidatus Dojkabacteria bacterium]|nr:UvrD-helicase domain-containing protein [Candidatus Dojkabacteria bacterium]MDQ7020693.1 UvrD-helicase domain-containing protein [Candidatus Dojkabacteria bacterium]
MIDLGLMNKEQKEAVVTTEGPLLVLAGAGSGKTRVLTYRIAYILDSGLAGTDNILAMTFTNKAAGEMKERISELLSESTNISAKGLFWMGTFHSICVKILKKYGSENGILRNFTIYDTADKATAIKDAMNTLNISTKEISPKAIGVYISSAKNELISPKQYESFAEGYFQNIVAKVYPEYQKILKNNNALDFDDLIMETIKLLTGNERILSKLQKDFRYILVDEYQDTNHAQYMLIKMLADYHKNICCVGDDDQSIYAFRGATIKNILNFEKDYPESSVIKLEQNYRSTKNILKAAHNVISKNKNRKDKELWTENTVGELLTLHKANDELKEGDWICEKINELVSSGSAQYDSIALLYRTNAQSRSLEEAFIKHGLPYKIVGGTRFYERKEIKDIIAYLRVIYNGRDDTILSRIINVPRRGIGAQTYMTLITAANINNKSAAEYLLDPDDELNPKVRKFSVLLKKNKEESENVVVSDLINFILEESGYINMLRDGTSENESRIENLKELLTVASRYDNLEPNNSLERFLEDISLLEGDSRESEYTDDGVVTLMTVHSAKGLEFPYVFIAGMEENLFPHSNSSFDDSEIEEERRLAYVAITRAKNKLFVTHTNSRKYFGSVQSNSISRFIEEIDPDLIELTEDTSFASSSYGYEDDDYSENKLNIDLKVGDKVKHEYFGIGKVVTIDDETIDVDFGAAYGIKELMLEYARLQKV